MTYSEAVERAKAKWNEQADAFNQWDNLGQDERDELIAEVQRKEKSKRKPL